MDDIAILYQRVLRMDHQDKGNELQPLSLKHAEKNLQCTNEAEQTSDFDHCKAQDSQCQQTIASHIQMIAWKSDLLSNVNVNEEIKTIIGIGSIADGTKIGNPDEFDFMIELPCLNEALEVLEPPIYDSFQSDEKKLLGIKKRELFDDFMDIDQSEKKDQDFLKRVWNAIQMETDNILETNALPGWKWLDTVPIFMTGLAQTHTLLFSGVRWSFMLTCVYA
ncbi:Hypothetical predicted protein [Mytilus galloprovincialis]|uniref:Uncharacterized protein n=1 Tax=Mytilus galloprovincialis TaxID=29158 RepID=A0A8B6GE65_MYTGA|nr:Hypothetical predicted protein [Mytilus galloprovincialis]